jgi:UDP-glucuronate decarboxylase
VVAADFEYIRKELSNEDRTKFSDSKIVISGAGGFVGYYMVNFLAESASSLEIENILVLDNFTLGHPNWIDALSKKYDFVRIYNFDVSRDRIEKIPGISDFDSVIHMASIASPTYYRKFPLKTIDANVWGLRNMLNFFSKRRIRGFLNFSSSEVYGDPDQNQVPIGEEYRGNVAINGPRACYDESKRFMETLCYVFNKEFGTKIVSVRPFNNYGPGMNLNDARAPADFANSVVNDKDIEVFSDGQSTRTFTYIADAIVGYLKALYYGKFEYFNIGMDTPEISIIGLAELYAKLGKKIFGYEGRIIYTKNKDSEYVADNPRRRCPDISKAREKLGFSPKIKIDEGVSRFLTFLKEETGK